MNIIETIKTRKSIRSYRPIALPEDQKLKLMEAIENSFTLFKGKLTIKLKSFDLKNGFKPSTYGFIKGASDFFY